MNPLVIPRIRVMGFKKNKLNIDLGNNYKSREFNVQIIISLLHSWND